MLTLYKAAVVGDKESISGFAALGLETVAVESENAGKEIDRLANTGYAVIYLTENMAEAARTQLEHYRNMSIPAVILIPGLNGNTGEGVNDVHRSVEKAVGSDIL